MSKKKAETLNHNYQCCNQPSSGNAAEN